ncbi:hypothetical protein [Prevotella sp. kh1p2]|uniref:hypothetical protein n=1 Tax=Prevotella sp. kh1p2 TaxID=1761883 RepID=UPI0008D28DA0|nr:hypothetical protein [Prevotella sp. kh1p2]SET24711.1 hypothetical protein SAMN04487825_1244 [Prevotella sp. kh1p2]SNU12378.1 hypothetical protein SAMN06298210_1245 [Prevotellaceae bacterium KH2P17]
MTKKNGFKLTYVEVRNPRPEADGSYACHPCYVGVTTSEKEVAESIRRNVWANTPQLQASLAAIRELTVEQLLCNRPVRVGDLFIVRPRLRLRRHKDAQGRLVSRKYGVGEPIPADDIEFCGLSVRATRSLEAEVGSLVTGCVRLDTVPPVPANRSGEPLARALQLCAEEGYCTVRSLHYALGVSLYKSRKLLESFCRGEHAPLVGSRAGRVMVYRAV